MKSTTLGRIAATGQFVVLEEELDPMLRPCHLDPLFDRKLLERVLAKVSLPPGLQNFALVQVDFGESIGLTRLVKTAGADRIVHAQREGALGMTRFVLGREPEPCNSVTIELVPAVGQANAYRLIDAFIGEKPEAEPWDIQHLHLYPDGYGIAIQRSLQYWGGPKGDGHAWLWEPDVIRTKQGVVLIIHDQGADLIRRDQLR